MRAIKVLSPILAGRAVIGMKEFCVVTMSAVSAGWSLRAMTVPGGRSMLAKKVLCVGNVGLISRV